MSVKLYAPPFRRLAWQGNMSSGGVTICWSRRLELQTGICPAGKLFSPTSTATLKNRQACLFCEYVHSHCFVPLKIEGLYSSVAVRVSTCYHWSEWAGSHDQGHGWCSSGFVWFSHTPTNHSHTEQAVMVGGNKANGIFPALGPCKQNISLFCEGKGREPKSIFVPFRIECADRPIAQK